MESCNHSTNWDFHLFSQLSSLLEEALLVFLVIEVYPEAKSKSAGVQSSRSKKFVSTETYPAVSADFRLRINVYSNFQQFLFQTQIIPGNSPWKAAWLPFPVWPGVWHVLELKEKIRYNCHSREEELEDQTGGVKIGNEKRTSCLHQTNLNIRGREFSGL